MQRNLENLLEPISIDEVCGADLEETGELFTIEQLLKGKEETQFSDAVPPNWHEIQSYAEELLKKSKDLWVSSYLISALFQNKKLQGLTDGLEFLLELLSKYWSSLFPLIDEDDDDKYSFRLAPLQTLFSLKGTLFEMISEYKVTQSKFFENHPVKEILKILHEKDEDKVEECQNAAKDTPQEVNEQTIIDIEEVCLKIKKIDDFIKEQVESADNIVDTAEIVKLLKSIIEFLTPYRIPKESEIEETEDSDSASDDSNSSGGKVGGSTKKGSLKIGSITGINSRTDVKALLKMLIDWYSIYEPASPVPLFLKRAEALVDKSFAEIIDKIADHSKGQLSVLFGEFMNSSGESSGASSSSYENFSNRAPEPASDSNSDSYQPEENPSSGSEPSIDLDDF